MGFQKTRRNLRGGLDQNYRFRDGMVTAICGSTGTVEEE